MPSAHFQPGRASRRDIRGLIWQARAQLRSALADGQSPLPPAWRALGHEAASPAETRWPTSLSLRLALAVYGSWRLVAPNTRPSQRGPRLGPAQLAGPSAVCPWCLVEPGSEPKHAAVLEVGLATACGGVGARAHVHIQRSDGRSRSSTTACWAATGMRTRSFVPASAGCSDRWTGSPTGCWQTTRFPSAAGTSCGAPGPPPGSGSTPRWTRSCQRRAFEREFGVLDRLVDQARQVSLEPCFGDCQTDDGGSAS
jgi:hypothetical protein